MHNEPAGLDEVRQKINSIAPTLWRELSELGDEWALVISRNLDRRKGPLTFPKTITDPILGPIDLFEWEVAFLDSPLLQRLRGVRQLGMVHHVYPGAVHDRLCHTLGVVEIADRMVRALDKNAAYHREYGSDPDIHIPSPNDNERFSIRMAALLHDTGHGPFSHATEPIIARNYECELALLNKYFRTAFPGATRIKPSEAVAATLVLTEGISKVFSHDRFRKVKFNPTNFPLAIAARIIGSWAFLDATYLSGVISGAIDADKLDYMVRDSYFSGLPVGLDIGRLIDKLEVITITEENAIDPTVKARAQKAERGRLYELGISMSGLTAYEQLIIGRVLLYERIYYHHKVRSAEAMVRCLFQLVERESAARLTLKELISLYSDDLMLQALGGKVKGEHLRSGESAASGEFADRIQSHQLHHRAFAFAERFIGGIEHLSKEEQNETRSALWQTVLEFLPAEDGRATVTEGIADVCEQLRSQIAPHADGLSPITTTDVIIDLPDERATAIRKTVLLRTHEGNITHPNLFFDPEKWSNAYQNQKRCGFIFTKVELIPLVSLGAAIYFYENFGLLMGRGAFDLCKVGKNEEWLSNLTTAQRLGICSQQCVEALSKDRAKLLRVGVTDLNLPDQWEKDDPGVKLRIEREFFLAMPGGFVESVRQSVLSAITHLCAVIQVLETNGTFKRNQRPDEAADLQSKLLEFLRIRDCDAREGEAISGGKSDIILPGNIVVENKVSAGTDDPFQTLSAAENQARRYAISLNRRVSCVILAYRPLTEAGILPLPSRIRIHRQDGVPEERAVIQMVIPWGHGNPSGVKRKRA